MTIDQPLDLRLATMAGRRAFDREVADMIRAGRFNDAGAFLERGLAHCRTRLADAARTTTSDAVRILDWEKLDAECARLLAAGVSIGAIGLNLSNYNDSSTGVWHDKEPAIEFSVYGHNAFDFSSTTLEEILRVSVEPPTPWQGRMTATERPVTTRVSGLRSLNSALLEYANASPWGPPSAARDGLAAPEEYVAFALGEWMLHLRFHQTVARIVTYAGLAALVPVLIGEHDVGPFIRSVVMPGRISGTPPRALDEPVRRVEGTEASDATTERLLDELDNIRNRIRRLGFFSRGKRRALVDESDAREAQLLRHVDLVWPRRSWDMSDAQFKAFAHAVRLARETSEDGR